MKQIAIAALLSTIIAVPAFAADDGWYILGGAGKPTGSGDKAVIDSAVTSAGVTGFSSSLSTPTVYKLQAGYQINKNFAVEGGYLGSTNETYSATGGTFAGPPAIPMNLSATAKISGWNLTAVGIFPVANQFSLLGKLGLASIRDSATVTASSGAVAASASTSGTKTDFTYGIGAQYDFTDAIFARLNLDSYKIGSTTSSSRNTIWTIDVGYKF